MSTQSTTTNQSLVDVLLDALESSIERSMDQAVGLDEEFFEIIVEQSLEDGVEDSIDIEDGDEESELSRNVRLAVKYNEGKLKLNEGQEFLLRLMFKGREEMSRRNRVLGEAITEVLKCKTKEDVEMEMEWWL